jgi:protein SCO1/2
MRNNTVLRPWGMALAAGLLALAGVGRAAAQPAEPAPVRTADNGPDEHLDAELPLDLNWTDSDGTPVTLGQFFDGTRPVILSLNYSNCPKYCSLQLNGLLQALTELEWNVGDKFQVVTVSIDPDESPERARETKDRYMKLYGREAAEAGWHFLTTPNKAVIDRLAEVVGFHYRYVPETKEYAHDVVLVVATPQGRISRYLYGFTYEPQTLRFALLEASQGRIGTTTDRILLYCYHYDASAGRYGPAAVKIMRLGGVLTLMALGSVLLVYWRRETKRFKQRPSES